MTQTKIHKLQHYLLSFHSEKPGDPVEFKQKLLMYSSLHMSRLQYHIKFWAHLVLLVNLV